MDAVERLEKRFFKLKQKPTEPVQYFIDKVIRKYNSINGRHLLQTLGNDDVQRPKNQEDICLKIFLNGVRPDVKKAMFNSQFLDDHSWASVTKAAVIAERVIVAHKLIPNSPATSFEQNDVVAGTEQHQQRKIPKCFHCSKRGHIEKDCWVLHGKPQPSPTSLNSLVL